MALVSIPNIGDPPGVESLPMCRLLKSLNAGNILHEVRRLQMLSSMERAGYLSRHSDGCGFMIGTHCPYFKGDKSAQG